MTENEICELYSNPRLRRNILPRAARKLNMEFDASFGKMTPVEREEFLDRLYPEESENVASDR